MVRNVIDDISVNTIIGAGAVIRGSLSLQGLLRVDGDVDGDINADGKVIIGEFARIRGNIRAAFVSIGGIVQGDIIASHSVVVLASGVVLGSILTKKLRVDDGVVLHGFCSAVNDLIPFDEIEKKYHNRKAALRLSGASATK